MQYAVGLDLGATAAKAGLVDSRGGLVAEATAPTGPRAPEAMADLLADLARDVLAQGRARLGRDLAVAGIGLGVPGPCAGDILRWAPNLGWRDVPLAGLLAARAGWPVRMENDASAAALGEAWAGAAQGLRQVVLLTLGTGVGGGLVLDGRLYRGAGGWAGEIGHMPAGTAGRLCSCGKRDCLEAYASATALARQGRELHGTPAGAGLQALAPAAAAVTARHVTAAAAAGDAAAQALVAEAAAALAQVIGGVINLLNPERVLLGGGVAQAGETLLSPLRRALPAVALPEPLAACPVQAAGLGNRAGLIGAAALWLGEGRL